MKILFVDWNGTLAKDMALWERSMRATFRAFGKVPPTPKEFFEELKSGDYLEVYRKRGITASREELNEQFHAMYLADMHKVQLAAGAKRTLRELRKRGIYLVLLTAQIESLVAPLLEKFSLYSVFAQCLFHRYDKDVAIGEILIKTGASPHNCFMLGDAPSDMRNAKEASITAIGFLNKANSEASLKAAGANCCIRKFEELMPLLA